MIIQLIYISSLGKPHVKGARAQKIWLKSILKYDLGKSFSKEM